MIDQLERLLEKKQKERKKQQTFFRQYKAYM